MASRRNAACSAASRGRTGSVVGKGLLEQGLPIVVIEQDRRRVEDLRAGGIPIIYGDATTAGVLEAAGAARAMLIVVATPESFRTRRILELARQLNPNVQTAVRADTESEVVEHERDGIGIAIMAERELAFGLLAFAFRVFGVPSDRADAALKQLWSAGDGGAFARRRDEPERGAPELRPHRDEEEPQP